MIYEKNENRSKSGTVMKSVLGCLYIGLSWVSKISGSIKWAEMS